MKIAVSGANIDTGSTLREHIEEAVRNACNKYFGDAIAANVVVTKEANLYKTNASLHLKRNTLIRSEGSADTPYGSVHNCVEALDKQLRRLKRKTHDSRRSKEREMAHGMDVS